jgi:hypothetical protein
MKITIENVEYDLDIDAAKAANVLTVVPLLKMGDKFQLLNCFQRKNQYILASAGTASETRLVLVSLTDGNCWTYSVKVKNILAVTPEEFYELAGNEPYRFKKID